jgi:hypothetical protein
VSPNEWEEERSIWCPIVFLNLVQGVNVILECLKTEMADSGVVANIPPRFSNKHEALVKRLDGLITVQRELEGLLDFQVSTRNSPDDGADSFSEDETERKCKGTGLTSRSTHWWQALVCKLTTVPEHCSTLDKIAGTLESHRADIKSLWDDEAVRELLAQKRAPLETMAAE